jgi:hypothetical protein
VKVTVRAIAGRYCLLQCAAGRNAEEADSGKVDAKFRAGPCECGARPDSLCCSSRFSIRSSFYLTAVAASCRLAYRVDVRHTADRQRQEVTNSLGLCAGNSAAYEYPRF